MVSSTWDANRRYRPTSVSPKASSFDQQFLYRRGDRLGQVRLVAGVHPQRSAMSRELLDVEDRQTVLFEDGGDGVEREVREVLVIDGVELVFVDQAEHVRELERDHPFRGQDQRPCRRRSR